MFLTQSENSLPGVGSEPPDQALRALAVRAIHAKLLWSWATVVRRASRSADREAKLRGGVPDPETEVVNHSRLAAGVRNGVSSSDRSQLLLVGGQVSGNG
jgi:hypothetical protein